MNLTKTFDKTAKGRLTNARVFTDLAEYGLYDGQSHPGKDSLLVEYIVDYKL